jgi:hypothetical protein
MFDFLFCFSPACPALWHTINPSIDPSATQLFFQRFSLVLWRAHTGAVDWSLLAPTMTAAVAEWQIFATRDSYFSRGYSAVKVRHTISEALFTP